MIANAPTLESLHKFVALEERRRELGRQVSDIEKEQEDLREQFTHYVHEVGGSDRTTMRHEFRLTLIDKASQVSWAKAYIALAGAEAAEKLRKAAPKKESLIVDEPTKEDTKA